MNPIEVGIPEHAIAIGYALSDENKTSNEVIIYRPDNPKPYGASYPEDCGKSTNDLDVLCRLKIVDVPAGLHLMDCVSDAIEAISGWNPFKDMLEQLDILKATVVEIKEKI